ncbi:MAG: THUMP domain-containing protein [Candidatus Thermoplasmatota archaeon]|nr:THUMP domain-containing protein [Candidatus Thermoplasmatota archaeon]
MKYELILIRYGEIALKGKVTRRYFENALVKNIKSALKTENISHTIGREWGRIYVFTSQIKESIDVLRRIFGITSFSPSLKTTAGIGAISDFAVDISRKILTKEKSFALRVTRTGNHEFTSQDVAISIGSDIVGATHAKVDLNTPDLELFIEIRNENAFLFTKKIRGIGGMPLNTQGKALALIDDSKSILAAWYLMRRGCKVVFLNTNKSNVDALQSFMSKWYVESGIHALDVKENIYESLNKKASEEKCDAVVTGHTLNENLSDSLSDISQLKRHVDYLILHPLIAMGKNEINKKCEEVEMLA